MIVEIGGIDDHDQRVGQALAVLRAGDDIARDAFVGGGGLQAVRAGQVDQFDRPPVVEHQPPDLPLDRDAGIIADLLARTGQRIEQRALAGIGIADQRNQRCCVHSKGLFGRGRHGRNLDRTGDRTAERDGHATDPTGDRALAQRRAVQDLDIDTFVEA